LLKHRQPFISIPHAETPLFNIFFISSHPCHFLTVPVAETPATFHFPPVAETPITSNLSSVFPFTPSFFYHPSLPKKLRPTIVSPLFVAETPFASNSSSFIHDVETPPFNTL
jgi:hypothetical protein